MLQCYDVTSKTVIILFYLRIASHSIWFRKEQ